MSNNSDKGTRNLNVPTLRFPEFEGEWEKKQILEVANIIGGGTPDTTIPLFWNGAIQWFTPSEIGKSKYVDLSKRTITEEGLKKSSTKILPKGSILLSTRATIGECSICKMECTTNQGFQSLVPKEIIDNEFMYYQVLTLKNELIRKSSGSTFLEISANELRKLFIRLPHKIEQTKIADFLSLIDQRISTQNKIIESLESLIKGLTNQIINSLCDKQLTLFQNLYERAGEGGTPSTSVKEFYEDGHIPFIKIEDLYKKYLTHNKDFITEKGVEKSSAWIISPNSIIFSNGATIGAISISTYPVCTKQGILGIEVKKKINVEYLYYLMSSSFFKKEICRIVTEGTMKTAYLKDINLIKCPIPSEKEQNEIADLLSSLTAKFETEKNILSALQKQKGYLLQTMFI